MSINNQMLIKEHKGKFYVFDVMAESWGEWDGVKFVSKKNYLDLNRAIGVADTREAAHALAHKLDSEEYLSAEYGVIDEVLAKDGKPVIIREQLTPEKGI